MKNLIADTASHIARVVMQAQEDAMLAAWREYFPHCEPTPGAINRSGIALVHEGTVTDGLRFFIALPAFVSDETQYARVSAVVEFKITVLEELLSWSFTQIEPKPTREEVEHNRAAWFKLDS